MANTFNNRVFGAVVIKSINSNYNADFSHQPRTLPDGTAYATDKALKYLIRNYWVKFFKEEEKVFYFKRFNDKMNPYDLDGAYTAMFSEIEKNTPKDEVLKNLLSTLDIKFFGATFANKKGAKMAISIHGPLQIGHGVNRYPETLVYPEQIMSPFSDQKEGGAEAQASTLGTQYKLAEGHFVHHFSLNPSSLDSHLERLGDNPGITEGDVEKLKQAMRLGATYFDSAAKAGTENELLLWIQLKEGSRAVLPSITQLVKIEKRLPGEKTVIDLSSLNTIIGQSRIRDSIEKIELYVDDPLTEVKHAPEGAIISSL